MSGLLNIVVVTEAQVLRMLWLPVDIDTAEQIEKFLDMVFADRGDRESHEHITWLRSFNFEFSLEYGNANYIMGGGILRIIRRIVRAKY